MLVLFANSGECAFDHELWQSSDAKIYFESYLEHDIHLHSAMYISCHCLDTVLPVYGDEQYMIGRQSIPCSL